MKFNCGPTEAEKRAAAEARHAAEFNWHPVFAWLPVRVGSNDCRWLEIVERRRVRERDPCFKYDVYFLERVEYRALGAGDPVS